MASIGSIEEFHVHCQSISPYLEQIEFRIETCQLCQEMKPSPHTTPMYPLSWPDKPWQRVHADFAGQFQGHMFLVLIDAHSK